MATISTMQAASFVGRKGQYLTFNGKPIRLHGGTFYGAPWRQDSFNAYVDHWLDALRDNQMNTVRICDFIDNKNLDQWKDARTWQNVDYLVKSLEARKMYAVLDLSTYRNLLERMYKKDPKLDKDAFGIAAAYDAKNWKEFAAFVSARYKNSTCIAFYSIAGEAEIPANKVLTTAGLTDFYDKVSTWLRAGDPNHLVSSGGLLCLDWNSGIDWKKIFSLPNIQIASVHVYSDGDRSVVPTISDWAKEPAVNIPFLIEEFGFKQGSDDAARAMQFKDIYSLSARYTSVGALFWNIGAELRPESCDVGPQTPIAWAAIKECESLYRNPPAAVNIHNEELSVTCDRGQYEIRYKNQPKPFATGRMHLIGGAPKVIAVKDRDFGQGKAIEMVLADGRRETFQLFSGLPFVLYSETLANTGKEPEVLNKVPMMDLSLAAGKPPELLVGLGTGGLKPLDQNPGSFAWMAVADPNTRNGIVGGWLTHEHATGVVSTKVAGGKLGMEARLEYGTLRIEPQKTVATETFALGWFADARLGMEAWADAVAKRLVIKLPPKPTVYCTWYDNKHNGSSNEKFLAELAAFAAKELEPYGFSCVQIDDGWQTGDSKGNGPAKNFSQYNTHGNFPSGMKATADNLHSLGLTAGLWMVPFGGSWDDAFFANHQDWFVKRKDDGKPYDTKWGGTALDMTEPGARAFVAGEIKQIVHDWGYHYLKLDGLSTGIAVKPMYIQDSWMEDGFGDAVFHDPSKTNIDAFRDGLRLVREAAGPKTFILGCCAPQNMRSYAGVFGLVDAMRMGPDNDGSWSAWRGSPDFGSRNYHLNGRIWWSDPDPMYVRASIPLESARCMASWNSLSGQMISLSDWLPDLPADRIDILRRTIPSHNVTSRPVDLFKTWPPKQWLVTDERPDHQRRDVLGLYNWSQKAEDVTLKVSDLGLPLAKEYIAFDFWNRVFLKPFKDTLTVNIPGAACRVLAVRPLLSHPFLLSTSRHVTQGIVEVKKEVWDQKTGTLAGTSTVVAGDTYELRVVASSSDAMWNLSGATLSAADKTAGVTIASTSSNGLVRTVIKSPVSRDVTWSLNFSSGKSTAAAKLKVEGATFSLSEDGEDVNLKWKPLDGATCEVVSSLSGAILSDTGTSSFLGLAPDHEIRFHLTPISWAGQRGDTTELVVKTPKARQLPPMPPKPAVSITTLKPIEARTGYGDVSINQSMDKHPLTVGGLFYKNGIGVHAESELVYDVKPAYRRFVAVAGIDDEVKNSAASVTFKVIGEFGSEKRQLASSPRLFAKSSPALWHFDIAIPEKCTRLRLVVGDAGDGISNDHADWVDAGFVTGAP